MGLGGRDDTWAVGVVGGVRSHWLWAGKVIHLRAPRPLALLVHLLGLEQEILMSSPVSQRLC